MRPEHLPKERNLSVYLSEVEPLRDRGQQSVTTPRSLAWCCLAHLHWRAGASGEGSAALGTTGHGQQRVGTWTRQCGAAGQARMVVSDGEAAGHGGLGTEGVHVWCTQGTAPSSQAVWMVSMG